MPETYETWAEKAVRETGKSWSGSFGLETDSNVHEQDVDYDATEQDQLMEVFTWMLRQPTKDGGNKRAAGIKEPWWRDTEHEAAIFSHLCKWKRGELVDDHSGMHPLVHAAWRCLGIAFQEMYGQIDPLENAAWLEAYNSG